MKVHAILQEVVGLLSNLNSFTWFSLVVFLLYFYWRSRPHAKFPPGPIGFPIVGVLPHLSKSPAKVFKKWSLEQYGPIMSARMGIKSVVVLNTFEAINKAFVKKGSMFSDRAWHALFCRESGHGGIVFQKYDEKFKTQKHFALKYFREKGLGKKTFEALINDEGDRLVNFLKDKHKPDDTVNLKEYFYLLTSNVIMQTAFGKHYDYGDETFRNLLNKLTMLFSDPKYAKRLSLVFGIGFLARFPPFAEAVRVFGERLREILGFINVQVEEHRKRFDPDNVDDYIDAFIYEQRNGKTPKQSGFIDTQLITVCRDFFAAGSETTSTTLAWLFVFSLHYPDYQKQIDHEIEEILGTSGIPSMSNRLHMPITCAFIQEVMRIKTITPFGVQHCTSAEVELEGYVLPKGTIVMANLDGAHMDPETWPDPEKFDPHRHIDEEGKFVASNKIIPFSIGPRFCLGESLARVEIFIFFVKIIQRFTIRCATEELPSMDPIVSTVVAPRECKVKLEVRM